jgi:hypothetical protein
MARFSGPLFFMLEEGRKVEWLPNMLITYGNAIRNQS